MKTVEEKRVAVLAECERLCPQTRDKYPYGVDIPSCVQNGVDISCSTWNRGKPSWWVHDLLVYEYQDDRIINLAYRLLGLSERDAVASIEKRLEIALRDLRKECDFSGKLTDENTALQAKNAALVAALDEIKNDNTLRPYETFHDLACRMAEVAESALAANEKGGANG